MSTALTKILLTLLAGVTFTAVGMGIGRLAASGSLGELFTGGFSFAAKAPEDPREGEWQEALGILRDYRDANRRNLHAEVFSAQAYALGERCYAGRSTWAGDFVRGALLTTARDIAARPDEWTRESSALEWAAALHRLSEYSDWELVVQWAIGIGFAFYNVDDPDVLAEIPKVLYASLEGSVKGFRHIDEHLQPFFHDFIARDLRTLASQTPVGPARTAAIAARMQALQTEHEALIQNGVIPAIEQVFAGLPTFQAPVREIVPGEVRGLRKGAFQSALQGLRAEGVISASEALELSRLIQ